MSKKHFLKKRGINQMEMTYSNIKPNGYHIVFKIICIFMIFIKIT